MSKIQRSDMDLPPAVERGMILRAQGKKWSEIGRETGYSGDTLRRWFVEDERCRAIVDNLLREELVSAYSCLASNGVAMADRLVQIALDPRTRPYAASGAIKTAFEILEKGLLDREMRQQVEAMRQQLTSLESVSH